MIEPSEMRKRIANHFRSEEQEQAVREMLESRFPPEAQEDDEELQELEDLIAKTIRIVQSSESWYPLNWNHDPQEHIYDWTEHYHGDGFLSDLAEGPYKYHYRLGDHVHFEHFDSCDISICVWVSDDDEVIVFDSIEMD